MSPVIMHVDSSFKLKMQDILFELAWLWTLVCHIQYTARLVTPYTTGLNPILGHS